MGNIFKPKMPTIEAADPLPTSSDEAGRRAAELERRKRGKSGRASTILTSGRQMGLPKSQGGVTQPKPQRTTILAG